MLCLRRGSEDDNYGTVIIKRGPLMKAMNIAMDRVSVIPQGVRIVCVRGRVRPGKCVRAGIRGRSNVDREKIGTR